MLAAISVVVAVYLPGLNGSFIFDDYPNIVDQPSLHIDSLSVKQLTEAANSYEGRFTNRPIATISLGLNHYLHGLNAGGYKLTNLLLHLLNLGLVFLLARILLKQDSERPRSNRLNWPPWAPIVLALLWAIHPLQISTVLYAVQRMEILALTFTLVALLSYIAARRQQLSGRGHGGWLLALSLASVAAGFLSKETAAIFPIFAACLEITFFKFRASSPLIQKILRSAYWIVLALGLAVFVMLLPQYLSLEAYAHRHFTWDERLLTQLRALPLYIGLILLPNPDRMIFFYDSFSASSSLTTPWTTVAGALVLTGLITLAIGIRRAAPIASLGIMWFFSAHLLTSNIFSLELIFEHRNYFAIFPILLALAALIRMLPTHRISMPPIALALVLIAGLSTIAAIRSATWGDRFNLAMHHAAINPTSERAHTELGVIYGAMSNQNPQSFFHNSAILRLERAAEQQNASPLPEQALILLAVLAGSEIRKAWWHSLQTKLLNRPIGAQEKAAVQNLLESRVNGLPIPDDELITVLEILMTREHVDASLFANFGYYALRSLDDDLLAKRAFRAAGARLRPGDERLGRWQWELTEAGHHEVVKALSVGTSERAGNED